MIRHYRDLLRGGYRSECGFCIYINSLAKLYRFQSFNSQWISIYGQTLSFDD